MMFGSRFREQSGSLLGKAIKKIYIYTHMYELECLMRFH